MSKYRRNHYVPIWYQELFIPPESRERKFYYLDMRPETCVSQGKIYKRNEILRWGPKSCFYEDDLYTTVFGSKISTEIEQKFFGPIDARAPKSIEYFANFRHPSADAGHFRSLLRYMSIQKLRTPKGLQFLADFTKKRSRNQILYELQRLQQLFCAIWSESVWSIADASSSSVKFLVSDHPVTVYNQDYFPASELCKGFRDPNIWQTGTHTIFPLAHDKLLILTNLSWVRYPYGNPRRDRPNPNPLRPAMFNFMQIQTGRKLSDEEVIAINYIIKMRASRYIASAQKEQLYPERHLGLRRWDSFGKSHLLMPDPRSVTFSNEIIIGYKDKRADSFDAYGRKPWQDEYDDQKRHDKEWETFHAFQGEFARLFGPKRRGVSYELGRIDNDVDSEDFHRYHLNLEHKFKKHRVGDRRKM